MSCIIAGGGGLNTEAEPSFTVWDIPNDSFVGHKASKTLFYGAPNYTSTPIKREYFRGKKPKLWECFLSFQ